MRRLSCLVCVALLAGCGYFNSLYNANRRFADAERARARGDATARAAYYESIDKAAVSYRKYPNGRWADDALLLIGRARFALGEDEDAIGALQRVLLQSQDAEMTALAHAYLGAAFARRTQLDSAVTHLNVAVDRLPVGAEAGAFARLWRARVAFEQGRVADGWADQDALAAVDGSLELEIALQGAERALLQNDSIRFKTALERLAAARDAGRSLQDVLNLLERAALHWTAADVVRMSTPLERTDWGAEPSNRVALARAQLAIIAADTATAVVLAERVADRARSGVGSAARLLLARWRLATLDEPTELESVRALLLPAFDEPKALELQRLTRAVQILALRADAPASALSLFAAAEMARDELDAPRLARRFFLDFAALSPQSPWTGKALLAARLLAHDAATDAALAHHHGNVYLRAARGEATGEEYTLAEQRLVRGLTGLRAEALAEAVTRDVVVGRALSVLDSTRVAARNDSVRIVCVTMIDSLRIAGIRADSVRSACLRGDSTRVAFVLRADTTLLADSAARARARPGVVRPDTSTHRTP